MDFVGAKGWEAFRALEAEVIADAVKAHPTGHIVACGGGIVETPTGPTRPLSMVEVNPPPKKKTPQKNKTPLRSSHRATQK